MTSTPSKSWWKKAYTKKYLDIYVDNDTAKIREEQIDFLLTYLKLKKTDKILDLACGFGRHSIELAKLGYDVTGLDYSKDFITLAKQNAKEQGVNVQFLQKDMMKLSYSNQFSVITNMFTSFGYFPKEVDHLVLMKKIARALKPGGKFLLDLGNTIRIIRGLQNHGKVNRQTGIITEVRKKKLSNGIDATVTTKFNIATMRRFTLRTWKIKGKRYSYEASVRHFVLPELIRLLEASGLELVDYWGDYDGRPFSIDSQRMILLAKKPLAN